MAIINDNFKLDYTPARIPTNTKELCIVYYAWSPEANKIKRKVMRFNHLAGKYNKREISRIMNKAVAEINMKLEAGKNPFIEAETPKSYHKLSDATEFFLRMKKRDMRPDGFRTYTSYCKKLNEWTANNNLKDCFVISFNKDSALEFMNELSLDEWLSNRTWNNHFVFYRTLWNWLKDNNYCKVNIFESFNKKREEDKIRKVIPANTHFRIKMYCRWFMPNFEIVIDLIRGSFIRPSELALIQIKDINLFEKYIFIPKEKAKTHRDRYAYLPDWLCLKIVENFNLERFPMDHYFIGSLLNPTNEPTNTRKYDKYWVRIRRDLKLEMDMQLYSYRDTGITALEDAGVLQKVITKLTDHTTVKMLRKYIGPPSKELLENVVSKIPD